MESSSESLSSTRIMEEMLPMASGIVNELPYIEKEIGIQANLFKISLKKSYDLYKYSLKFDDEENDLLTNFIKRQILESKAADIFKQYGFFFHVGDAFYSMNKVTEVSQIVGQFRSKEYNIHIQPTDEIIEMRPDTAYMLKRYHEGKQEIKSVYEIMVKEVLRHNPSLNYYMNLYGFKDKKEKVEAAEYYNSVNIIPGFLTNVMFLESGIYLNVDIKNKILSSQTVLELMLSYLDENESYNMNFYRQIRNINDYLIEQNIETIVDNHRYIIKGINYDKTAGKTSRTYKSKTITLCKYYKELFGLEVNEKCPLLEIQKKNKKQKIELPAELAYIVGLNDETKNDKKLLANITKFTKMKPSEKIKEIKDIIKVMNCTNHITKTKIIDGKKEVKEQASPADLMEKFGLEIIDPNENLTTKKNFNGKIINNNQEFKGKIIKLPELLGENNIPIKNINQPFHVNDAIEIHTALLYSSYNKKDAETVSRLMKDAAVGYKLKIKKITLHEMKTNDLDVWKNQMHELDQSEKYNIITILLNKKNNDNFYESLKEFSMEKEGFITQFIKIDALKAKKFNKSIISNILLQMNQKIGGCSCKISFPKNISENNYMVVGVDSSYKEGNEEKIVNISFVATISKDLTEYFSCKEANHIEDYCNTNLPIANFLSKAIKTYYKRNKQLPKNIIIYRQGVSEGQKNYIEAEVQQIHRLLNGKGLVENSKNDELTGCNIKYYYVLVNKKSTLKFFEKQYNTFNEKGKNDYGNELFDNPSSGLLVCDKIIAKNKFQFYIQPQKVSQGTATPTSYCVEYGNMSDPDYLPKLTFDLCFLYSNWKGPVRVPAPLKYAEKLAKGKSKINQILKETLSYL